MRFGVYELDARAGVLRKNGAKVRLPEQPLQILTLLLERPGEIVTRDEICKKLWPDGTFVDFDHSLNAAVMRLREALDDAAGNPRFIETIPRRGYRFLVPVEGPAPVAAAPAPMPRRRFAWVAASAGLVVLLLSSSFALNIAGLRTRLFAPADPTPQIRSIAVLPLKNLMNDPEQDYFVEGMHDALITDLAKLSGLKRVIARTSMLRYKGTIQTLPEIARELNVEVVVTGSVMRAGDRVRITVQLINAQTEEHLWAERYERELRDVLALQNEVVGAIAREIQLKLSPAEKMRLASASPVNPAAYEAYLQGRQHLNRFSQEGAGEAIKNFEQAAQIDPRNALPYTGLAGAYVQMAGIGAGRPKEAYRKAREAALRALELDDTHAEAHAAKGWVLFADWAWREAEREFRRAIELSPGLPFAHFYYSNLLSAIERHAEAVAEAQQALALDPLSPLINTNLGWRFMGARQFDQAEAQFLKTLKLAPNYFGARIALVQAYMLQGKRAEALAEIEKVKESLDKTPHGQDPAWVLAVLAEFYAFTGQPSEARKRLAEVNKLPPPIATLHIVSAHVGLGENDKALALLEQAFAEHYVSLVYLKVIPSFEGLRSDPRYKDLVRRMNFPQ